MSARTSAEIATVATEIANNRPISASTRMPTRDRCSHPAARVHRSNDVGAWATGASQDVGGDQVGGGGGDGGGGDIGDNSNDENDGSTALS